jgi:hypothetical protein
LRACAGADGCGILTMHCMSVLLQHVHTCAFSNVAAELAASCTQIDSSELVDHIQNMVAAATWWHHF